MVSPCPSDIPSRVRGLLEWAERRLVVAGVSEARVKVERLLAHLAGWRRSEWVLHADEELPPELFRRMQVGVDRLSKGEPLAYVIGTMEFWGLDLKVDYRVLIPRPETEQLVELVLTLEALARLEQPVFVDVGTGSGCIAITLAVQRPTARIYAVDISAEALAVARENAARHGVADRIVFRRQDLLEGFEEAFADAIVANLPYVRSSEWAHLPVEIRQYEPRDALDGGKDGLMLISRLVPEAWRVLKSGGWLFLEVAEDQGEKVQSWLLQEGFADVAVRRDWSGHPRFVIGRKE